MGLEKLFIDLTVREKMAGTNPRSEVLPAGEGALSAMCSTLGMSAKFPPTEYRTPQGEIIYLGETVLGQAAVVLVSDEALLGLTPVLPSLIIEHVNGLSLS